MVTTDDILAAIQERYIADAKKLFVLLRDNYVDRISTVMLILQDILDKKANENTLRQAQVLLKQANYVRFVPGKETPLGKATSDFVKSLVHSISEETASKRSGPMTRDEIVEEFKLSPKAAAAYDRGVTIGELFVIQPDLFL